MRAPDEIFDKKLELNFGGGITAQLLWFGEAHTKGDELVFVNPDKTLISGEFVQNKVGPQIFGEGGTASSWISAVEQAEKLGVLHVLPDHNPIGDGSTGTEGKALLIELRARALALKRKARLWIKQALFSRMKPARSIPGGTSRISLASRRRPTQYETKGLT